MKGSCILIPEINGEDSSLYKEILKENKSDRPLVNLIYALYLQPGVQAQMDAAGYKRNKQGQHRYKDVVEFLDIKEFKKQREVSLQTEAIDLGIMNKDLSYIDFTNVISTQKKGLPQTRIVPITSISIMINKNSIYYYKADSSLIFESTKIRPQYSQTIIFLRIRMSS